MLIPNTQFSISDKAFIGIEGTVLDNLHALRAVGFTHLHFSHHWTAPDPLSDQVLEQWIADLNESGIQVLDSHGCHSKGIQLWEESPEGRETAFTLFQHRLEVTRRLGGEAMVYHVPCHAEPTDAVIERFLEGLSRMEPIARELGIAVALENHYELENDRRALSAAFEKFDENYIGFTFDPGHALISGNTDWLLQNASPRLRVLHLNDNDSGRDCHWNPFAAAGRADWDSIMEAIARSPYSKPINLEVQWHQDQHESHPDFLKDAHAAARRIAETVNHQRASKSLPLD